MATANPLMEDIYELELCRVKEKIKTKFVELIDCLKVRENKLLRELDNILTSYLSYRSELEKVNEQKIALETTKTFLQNKLLYSPIKSIYENIILQLDTELKSIETPIGPTMFSFECYNNKMLAELKNLGKLVEKVNGIDYKSMKQPLVSVCEKGKGMEQLDCPRGVTVENETGNIYIADVSNDCVKVFDSTGKFLFKFGDNEDEGEMDMPLSVAICGNRILISQNHCILNYQLNGKFISKIGKCGTGELEFISPFGLTIDELNGNIYVSDCHNNRIQILSQDFRFISQFGKDVLKYPRDVKLSKEYIFVLDVSNPLLHLFSHSHILQKSVISRCKGSQVMYPLYFFIDQTDNILFSDCGSNSIQIFNNQFQLIHKITVSPNPVGITVDMGGRVIVVCRAKNNCLQIF